MTRERRRIALVLTAVLAVGLFGHFRGSGYRNFFSHDPREAHDYALDRRDGTTWEVRLARDGFDWPDEAPSRDGDRPARVPRPDQAPAAVALAQHRVPRRRPELHPVLRAAFEPAAAT